MSLFGSIKQHSRKLCYVPEKKLCELIAARNISSMDSKEEQVIENALLSAQKPGHKMSLEDVYETLKHLEKERSISINDRKAVMKIFEQYFSDEFHV
ncbi:MAG: hypothetical protein HN726_03080 [Candidatus Magasanikbacteria bacterium]|jgi:hypothetical protein|nr:hypothetical protein [Candidatus Magasanikbacteria bacterium]MBT4220805.1 hypothetical protein [Candidatus Magasanikbacteria bacterium]MBT4350150.1 hypothetical protein [Candidatus Magasanikbacteria bacterium]MBT4541407.1 hypothetical protein [Candidatus Magasanikbacteria bacterium]MBT6253153.1 hypothetical protein [Candidatus Magasanikbacteria bacterium]